MNIHGGRRTIILDLKKNITFILLGVKILWCAGDRDRQAKIDCYTDLQLLLLTITCSVIFKDPVSSAVSRPGFTLPEAHCGQLSQQGAQPLKTETHTDPDRIARWHLHISFRNIQTFLLHHT